MLNHITYSGFGRMTSETNGTIDLLFGFTGLPLDEFTTLQNSRLRWFSADLRRFLSEDPGGFAMGDESLYRYVGNAATIYVDPWGLEGKEFVYKYSDANYLYGYGYSNREKEALRIAEDYHRFNVRILGKQARIARLQEEIKKGYHGRSHQRRPINREAHRAAIRRYEH